MKRRSNSKTSSKRGSIQTSKARLDREPAIIGLASRLKAALASHRIEGVARQVGVTASAIYNWQSGANEPSLAKLIALAEATKVSVEWLATGAGQMRPEGPAGYLAPTWPDERAPLLYELGWWRKNIGRYGSKPPEHDFPPHLFEVPDDSMEPTLRKGDLVLAGDLDPSVAEAPEPGIYLVWFSDREIGEEEKAQLKADLKSGNFPKRTYPRRIELSARSFRIRCDNPAYLDVIDVDEKIIVFAWRVVWYGRII